MQTNSDNEQMPISQIGEIKLINRLIEEFPIVHNSTKLGIGDDSAVFSFNEKATVVSTDMLVESVHFNLNYVPLKHLGYKAIIVNLSDIYAMNATPSYVLVSIAVSNQFSVKDLETLYQGIKLACKNYKIELLGGDTTSSDKGLIISVTAIGNVEQNKMVSRKGAKSNELLVVSGDLGASCLGLLVLESENQKFRKDSKYQPNLEPYTYFVGRQLKPEARMDVKKYLDDQGVVPTSMIDISDGLSTELSHLSSGSQVSFRIYQEKIPVHPKLIDISKNYAEDYMQIVLNGGEDYELLFTIDQKDYPKLKGNPKLNIIGHVIPKKENNQLLQTDGTTRDLKPNGWESFSGLNRELRPNSS